MYRRRFWSLLCTLLATLLVAVGAYQTFGTTPKRHNAGTQHLSGSQGLDAFPDLVFALHDYVTEARLMMGFGGCFTFNNIPAQNDQFVGVLPAPGRFGGMTGLEQQSRVAILSSLMPSGYLTERVGLLYLIL